MLQRKGQDPPVDGRELASALAEVEALALGGYRDAMVLAGQLITAGLAGPRPTRSERRPGISSRSKSARAARRRRTIWRKPIWCRH